MTKQIHMWFRCGNCGAFYAAETILELLALYGEHMGSIHFGVNWHRPTAGLCEEVPA